MSNLNDKLKPGQKIYCLIFDGPNFMEQDKKYSWKWIYDTIRKVTSKDFTTWTGMTLIEKNIGNNWFLSKEDAIKAAINLNSVDLEVKEHDYLFAKKHMSSLKKMLRIHGGK